MEAGILAACVAGGGLLLLQGSLAIGALVAFASGFAFSMFFLSPDLDLVRSGPMRRWGRLSILWWPYAKLFRHRGISHHVLWGPLTRLAYLALFVIAVSAGVGAAIGHPLRLERLPVNVWAVLVGIYAPSVVHVLVDRASSAVRRSRRRKDGD